MKRNKIPAVILSIVMSMSLMMPSVEVLADEASDPSETQKTETVETKEPKATEKQTPKETEKQESKVTETQVSKNSEKQEPKENEKQEPAESKDNVDNPEESNETAVVEGNIPSQSASSPKKNANPFGTCGDNLTWSFENGTLTISGSGKMTNWTNSGEVPWHQFICNRNNGIRYVVFSGNITSIGSYAFSENQQIKSITIPDSVKEIGVYAFSWCEITSITIPDSVEIIRSHAFDNTSLTSISIPDSVTYIGDYAFNACYELERIKLPKSVDYFGTGVLKECRKLTSIELPKGVKSIGDDEFCGYSRLKSVTIPDSVRIIGKRAFDDCGALTSVTIPDSVTEIGDYAFSGCSELTSITIPKNVNYIGTSGFMGCYRLTNVYYGNSEDKWKTINIGSGNEHLQNANIHYGAAYSITVNSGKTDLAKAAEGTKVTVTANAAPSGKVFDKWIVVSGNVSFANKLSSTTTFTMPAENVEVTATYKDAEYTIKVNNGSATPATATAGTVITLTADAALSGKVFYKWIVDSGTVSLSNASSSTTTFTMPSQNVELTATYITAPSGDFIVKVNNGVATPSTSAPGLVVNVTANEAPEGTEFDKWEVVSGTVIFADSSSATTFFVMPAANVEITAKFRSSLSVKGKTATVKYSKLKKKNQSLDVSKVLTFVDKGQGQLSFAKVSGDSKILINKTTGNITVKKKLKKKTYTVKVKVMASGNESCNPSEWKTVTFKIKVK